MHTHMHAHTHIRTHMHTHTHLCMETPIDIEQEVGIDMLRVLAGRWGAGQDTTVMEALLHRYAGPHLCGGLC